MQRGTIIAPDGTERVIMSKGKQFSLTELQGAVGGYIECIILAPGNRGKTMYADDDAKGRNKAYNKRATEMMSPFHMPGDYVAGTVIIVEAQHAKDTP